MGLIIYFGIFAVVGIISLIIDERKQKSKTKRNGK